MRNKAVGFALVVLVATIGTQQAVETFQDRAAEVLAATRKAIGGERLASLKTFSAAARLQRNVGSFQMNADVEVLLETPDKYRKDEVPSTGGAMMSITNTSGFNGERPLMRSGPMGGGAMVIRMGPNGPLSENPTAEQKEEMNRAAVRGARHEASRLMLGWFGIAHPALKAKYAYVGEAESPDGRAHVIEITDEDGFKARLFIDQATNLPVMLSYQAPQRRVMGGASGVRTGQTGGGGGGQSRPLSEEERKKLDDEMKSRIDQLRSQPPQLVEYQLFFAEWTEMEGIKFPKRLQRAAAGTTEEEWEFTRIKVNPKLDARKFSSES